MVTHYCATLPCLVCSGGSSGVSVTSTFRMHEEFGTWAEAMAFALRLPPVATHSQSRLRAGRVTYEPQMLTFNYAVT